MTLRFLSRFDRKQEKKIVHANFAKQFEAFSKDKNLTDFTVKYSPLTVDEISLLCKLIRSRKNLTHLTLVGCRLSASSGFGLILKSIKRSKSLISLDFSENDLGTNGIIALAEVVQLRNTLVHLDISNTGVNFECCHALKTMLEYNKNIQSLDLNSNEHITEKGVTQLFQGILEQPLNDASSLVEIDLSECKLTDSICQLFGTVVSGCSDLVRISLADNSITSQGLKNLFPALSKPALSYLDLSGNQLGDCGASVLAKNLSVKTLLLNDTSLSEKGLRTICEAVAKFECVEELSIGENSVTEGVSIVPDLIKMVSDSTTLTSLDISRLKFSPDDIAALGDFIGKTRHCSLKKLNLAHTGITNDGAVHIANGLMLNEELEELNVTSNPFAAKGAKAFAKTFKRAKCLKVFRVTGQSRITAEGENYLADTLRFNKTLQIKGASRELDFLNEFADGKVFKWLNGKIVGWNPDAWEVVKRGSGQILATAIHNLTKEQLRQFVSDNIIQNNRNVVGQDMFEYVIRHTEAPALDVVATFVNKCKITLDTPCDSKASKAMSAEKRKSDDVTYRFIAKDYAKDKMVQEMAKNNRLFLGRYLTAFGPAIHQTAEVTRFIASDTLASGKDKNQKLFVQIYENDDDFQREWLSRESMKETLKAAGPFAIYDTILKEVEVHEDNSVVSFFTNITDLRHCINNLGVTSGYDLHETIFLARRAAQCLGTINNLGRIHGDFRPRNFLKVANKRIGVDPFGKSSKVLLPDKWVLFDLSKSVPHENLVAAKSDSSYMAPEVARVKFHKEFTEKTLPLANEKMDVWSFGVVLYQLLTGVHLFHSEQNTDRVYKEKERLELMNWINLDTKRQNLIFHRASESIFENETTFKRMKAAATDLVNWCLQGDPYNRPSFSDILQHPFFIYKTNVNYTDVDLLLGWYKKMGSDISTASHKNNRTHFHIINTKSDQCSDVLSVLNLYFAKVGCKVTSDSSDWKLDIKVRRQNVQKARTLIVLLEKDVLFRKDIVQKILWAKDSSETFNLILLDVSSAFTNAVEFNFNKFESELESKLDELVPSMLPIEKHLDLKQVKYERNPSKQTAWLKKYLMDQFTDNIVPLKSQLVPYRTREFQTQAMVDEILKRSGFVHKAMHKTFKLSALTTDPKPKEAKKDDCKVLILYNEESDIAGKLKEDAITLERRLLDLGIADDYALVGSPSDVLKHFILGTDKGLRALTTEKQTLVLCLVSEGFYDQFRETIVLLDSAKGLVSVVPISYNFFDVTRGIGKEEVLNLGLENKQVLDRLKDNRCYIPLPVSDRGIDLNYEKEAALEFIKGEAKKIIEVTKENERKSENEAYARYSHTNFFEAIY